MEQPVQVTAEPVPVESLSVAGKTLDVSSGLEIEGMDLSVLSTLREQLDSARREVADLETRLGHSSTSDLAPLVEEKTRTATLAEEKDALMHFIKSLKRDREAVEMERGVLERELLARRALLAGTPEAEAGTAEQAVDKEQTPVGAEGGKKHPGGEPGRDTGVERALMDVRRWLDDALTSWQKVRCKTFPVCFPSSFAADPKCRPACYSPRRHP